VMVRGALSAPLTALYPQLAPVAQP
jgi:hypothetical protein